MLNEVEALLFLTPRPLPIKKIAEILGKEEKEVLEAVERLKARYEGTALTVEEFLGSYRLNVKDEYTWIAKKLGLLPEFSRRELQIVGKILQQGEVRYSELKKGYRKLDELLEKLKAYGFIVVLKRGRSRIIKKTKLMDRYFGVTQET